MEQVDCVVIGAGVVGLAIAREMALRGRETIILERESAFGTVSSARNSEVIHAGIYYPQDSLRQSSALRVIDSFMSIVVVIRWQPTLLVN